jgi:Tol biopolymer transport system component
LRDIADVRFALEHGVADGGVKAAPRESGNRKALWLAAGAAALGVALVGWWAAGGDSTAPDPLAENPLARAQFTRFTDFPGTERDAAISRDGQFVLFVSDRDGAADVFLSQVGTGRFTNLTQGREITGDLAVRNAGFMFDGTEVWLGGRYGPDRPMRRLPLFGGTSRPFLEGPVVNVTWSPDGQRLAYHTGEPGDPLFVADRTGANARRIFIHPSAGGHIHFPTWSPDGHWIYFVGGTFANENDMDLWRISPNGGDLPERLTNHHNDVTYPTPIDARTVMYLSLAEDGSGPWLWALDSERLTTSRLSYGLESFRSLAASEDGRRLVATVSNQSASLWSVPITDGTVEDGDVKPYAVPTVRALGPRFGGEYLFYLSSLGSGDGLWRYDRSNGLVDEIWKGRDGALFAPAAISSDGMGVAIALRGRDKTQLHSMRHDGTRLTPLAETIDVSGAASWSPDRAWIVTGGADAEGEGLFKVPVDGGAPVRLAAGPASDPVWSPDGSVIVYRGTGAALDAALVAVRPDGTPVGAPAIQVRRRGQRYRFLPNGALVYMQGQTDAQDFWLVDFAAGATPRRLTRLTGSAEMRAFDITPDGQSIVFDRLRDNSDIVLIDVPR